jgi:hypothetical protein
MRTAFQRGKIEKERGTGGRGARREAGEWLRKAIGGLKGMGSEGRFGRMGLICRRSGRRVVL